jgi:hypothetical protein
MMRSDSSFGGVCLAATDTKPRAVASGSVTLFFKPFETKVVLR